MKLSDKEPSKPSPLTMDLLSLIWYLTTLLALIGFFVVMACTENTCGRRSGQKPEDLRSRPPTPAPSYRNFAPPSYDSVMKKYKSRIYIVPVHENNDFFHQNLAVDSSNSESSIKDVVIDINDINSTISPQPSQDQADSSTSNFESAQSSFHTSFSQNCTISAINSSNSSQNLNLEPENVTISNVPNLNGLNASVANQNNTNFNQNNTNSNQNHTSARQNHTNSQVQRNCRENQERRGSRSQSNTNTYQSKKAEALAAVR